MSRKPRRNRKASVAFTREVQNLLSQVPQEEKDTGVLKRAALPDQSKDWAPTDIEQAVSLGQAFQPTSDTQFCRSHFSEDDSAEA